MGKITLLEKVQQRVDAKVNYLNKYLNKDTHRNLTVDVLCLYLRN